MRSKLVKIKRSILVNFILTLSWKNNFDMFVYKVGIVLKKIIGENLYKEIAEIKHKLIG